MSDLIAFLGARLDEDQQAAQTGGGESWSIQLYDKPDVFNHGIHSPTRTIISSGEVDTSDGLHIVRHDPARVLRELESKREILRLHGRMSVEPGHPAFNDAHLTTDPMVLCRSCEPERMWRRERSWPCRTLRALALPYADHPDYRAEWRP